MKCACGLYSLCHFVWFEWKKENGNRSVPDIGRVCKHALIFKGSIGFFFNESVSLTCTSMEAFENLN